MSVWVHFSQKFFSPFKLQLFFAKKSFESDIYFIHLLPDCGLSAAIALKGNVNGIAIVRESEDTLD